MDYCNTTTDLTAVFPKLDRFQYLEELENWTQNATYSSVYEKRNTGYISQVFENGTQLTAQTTVALVNSNAGSFYYDTDIDILYLHASDSNAPSTHEIMGGEDWDAFKAARKAEAQQLLDSMLGHALPVPLTPRLIKTHGTADYDYPIVRSAALLTCYLIVKRVDDEIADGLYEQAKEIVDKILSGEIHLTNQITGTEPGGWNVTAKSSDAGYVLFSGEYTGSTKQSWRLQIDASGAVGTATWKLSRDGGSSFDIEGEDTYSTDDRNMRRLISNGIYAEFYGTFIEDDYWDLTVYPKDDKISTQRVGHIDMVR